MITRAEHSISPGKADTKIVSKWVADTNGRFKAAENDNVKVVDRNPQNRTSKKCMIKKRGVPKERFNLLFKVFLSPACKFLGQHSNAVQQ